MSSNFEYNSRVALGTWRIEDLTDDQIDALLIAAADAQIDVLDTAPVYGWGQGQGLGLVEAQIGRAFTRNPKLHKQFKIVTKAGIIPPLPYDSGFDELTTSAHASCKRMGIDAIDLFLIHRPDNLTPWSEVARALNALHAEGIIKSAGVSNFSTFQIDALQSSMDFALTATQPEISLTQFASLFDGTLDHAQQHGLLPMAWSPIAGIIDGRATPQLLAEVDRQAALHKTDRVNIALAWLMAHPSGVMPILGTTKPERVTSAAKASEIILTRREWYQLFEAARGAPMP